MNYRVAGLLILVLSLLVFVASVLAMSRRAAAYNAQLAPEQHEFERYYARSFQFHARPVSFTDVTLPAGGAGLRIDFGKRTMTIPVRTPPVSGYKDLSPYTEWLAVVMFAPISRGQIQADPRTGAGTRLAVVNRRTQEGTDPQSTGDAHARYWIFDIHELKPDGTIESHAMQYPRYNRYKDTLELPSKKYDPGAQVEMMQERTWQWQAGLFALPQLQIARYRYQNDAARDLGWTLPVAAGSGLAGLVGVGLLRASSLDRKRGAAASAAA